MAGKKGKSRPSQADAEPPTRRMLYAAVGAYVLWLAFLVILAVLQQAT